MQAPLDRRVCEHAIPPWGGSSPPFGTILRIKGNLALGLIRGSPMAIVRHLPGLNVYPRWNPPVLYRPTSRLRGLPEADLLGHLERPPIPYKAFLQEFEDLQTTFINVMKASAEGERDRRAFWITPICRVSPMRRFRKWHIRVPYFRVQVLGFGVGFPGILTGSSGSAKVTV